VTRGYLQNEMISNVPKKLRRFQRVWLESLQKMLMEATNYSFSQKSMWVLKMLNFMLISVS